MSYPGYKPAMTLAQRQERHQQFIADYLAGMDAPEIAAKHKVVVSLIYTVLRNNKVQMRPKGSHPRKLTSDNVIEIRTACKDLDLLAKKLGISRQYLVQVRAKQAWAKLDVPTSPGKRGKLSEQDISEIARSQEDAKEVALKYGITRDYVVRLRRIAA